MQLDRDLLADESMKEPVDLRRLYTEIVESFVDEINGESDIHVSENVSIASSYTDDIRCRVREVGYDGLIQRQWINVVAMDPSQFPELVDALDPYEQLVQEFGPILSVQDPTKLRPVFRRWRAMHPGIDPQVFSYLLAETAVNQALDRCGIGRLEMRAVHDQIGMDLATESVAIVEMVRTRIQNLL